MCIYSDQHAFIVILSIDKELFLGVGVADPLYINELDTLNSLLHHKKHVRGSSDIGFVTFNFA